MYLQTYQHTTSDSNAWCKLAKHGLHSHINAHVMQNISCYWITSHAMLTLLYRLHKEWVACIFFTITTSCQVYIQYFMNMFTPKSAPLKHKAPLLLVVLHNSSYSYLAEICEPITPRNHVRHFVPSFRDLYGPGRGVPNSLVRLFFRRSRPCALSSSIRRAWHEESKTHSQEYQRPVHPAATAMTSRLRI